MPKLLHDLLVTSAGAFPAHLAACWQDERIPYSELDQLTNQLAHTLRAIGCHPGDRVVVLIPNSPNALFAILGILKAGCVAVPIDSATPAKLLRQFLDEAQPVLILAARSVRSVLDDLFAVSESRSRPFGIVAIGTLEALPLEGEHFATLFSGIDILKESAARFECRATLHSPALHFCGSDNAESTGSPNFQPTLNALAPGQPTTLSHAELLGHLVSAQTDCEIKERDRVAALPLQSPLAVAEAFAALAAGAELHFVPQNLIDRPRPLAAFVRSNELTDWLTDSGLISELVRSDAVWHGDFPALKRWRWVGDPLPADTLQHLAQRLPLTQFACIEVSSVSKFGVLIVQDQPLQEAPAAPSSELFLETVSSF